MQPRVLHRNIGILAGFIPLIVYGVLAGVPAAGVPVALAAAAAATVPACWSDLKKRMILAWANLILFTGLFVLVIVPGMTAIIPWTGAIVNASLAAVTFGSIATGTPFTLQYAREMVEPAVREKPGFIRANVMMTGAWGAVFAAGFVLACAGRVMPAPAGTVTGPLTYLVLAAGIVFTLWYPSHIMGKTPPSPVQAGNTDQ